MKIVLKPTGQSPMFLDQKPVHLEACDWYFLNLPFLPDKQTICELPSQMIMTCPDTCQTPLSVKALTFILLIMAKLKDLPPNIFNL